MIEKYYKLDVMQFYREYKGNQHLLKSLREEKESEIHAGGVDYSDPHVSSTPGDPTVQRVFRRLSTDRKIREIEEYFTLEKNIRKYLDGDEIMLANYLIDGKTTKEIADSWHLSESQTGVKLARFKRHIQDLTAWQTDKSGD